MRPLRALFDSPPAEKILHERAAFLFQHALSHFDAMIQKLCVADPEATADRAGAFVCGAVNQTPDARLNQSAGAHRARLDRGVNINVRQPVVAELTGSFAKRDDFSVSGRIAVGSSAISRGGDELIFTNDTSADRHLTAIFCLTCRGQRVPHPAFINLGFRGSFH